ncbi:flavodoxin family protein [Dethiosulfovibrio sp. F2B]|uniref:flavodoxin family protein n=1 Tax=Dethiosulfovibrio faecalis TaxID=2720018 RepID=UPI001F2B602C|nr:flavodoxin family protein [Dethiosulfovibrio faecalis]MCF4152338.1 flavodoxin family protein [Dethiosulfovibrio faecalis]
MRILAINGSPRGEESNTQRMIDLFFEGAHAEGADTDTIYVRDLNVGFCRGCFACWTDTPGRCIQRDDMDMVLEAIKGSDAVIWGTPLYHYGMTAMLKTVLERTLPTVDPHIVKEGDSYCHPMRDERHFLTKTLLFSNCGFPEMHHFDGLISQFACLFRGHGDAPSETILRPCGGMLRLPELIPHIEWYYDALRNAGKEFVRDGRISEGTHETLRRDIVDVEVFVSRANAYWDECLAKVKTGEGN